MAVDLFDLVESLRREVDPPGTPAFPDATEDEFAGHLADAFWEIRLDGMLSGYAESDGLVSPTSGTTELGRDLQQLIVLYAGVRIVRNQLRQLQTSFRAKAGPVEYETEQAASVLKGVLDDLVSRRNLILTRLSDLGVVDTYYIDSLYERDRWDDGNWPR